MRDCLPEAPGPTVRAPTSSIASCCARAPSGHAVAPAISDMKSRLLIAAPKAQDRRIVPSIISHTKLAHLTLAQQLRQLGDVGGDAPGLVAGEQSGRRTPSRLLLEIDVGERLPVGVADDEARRACAPRRTRAAGSGARSLVILTLRGGRPEHHISPLRAVCWWGECQRGGPCPGLPFGKRATAQSFHDCDRMTFLSAGSMPRSALLLLSALLRGVHRYRTQVHTDDGCCIPVRGGSPIRAATTRWRAQLRNSTYSRQKFLKRAGDNSV